MDDLGDGAMLDSMAIFDDDELGTANGDEHGLDLAGSNAEGCWGRLHG